MSADAGGTRADPHGAAMDEAALFEAERPRLLRIAARILDDRTEAEDVVQQAWLRLYGAAAPVDDLPAWLTTVTTRLCLDVLKGRRAEPYAEVEPPASAEPAPAHDPAVAAADADDVRAAMGLVVGALRPAERVAFVLHDSFAVDFATIGRILGCSPAAARKAASRARGRLGAGATAEAAPSDSVAAVSATTPADWEVVDAFLDAAREGRFARLVELLAPDVIVAGDAAAVAEGTPAHLGGRDEVAAMFNGAASSALPVFVDGRPGAAWFLRGRPRVAFDFTLAGGRVQRIDFRADPALLEALRRRAGGAEKGAR